MNTPEELKQIHQLASAIADWTKDKANISEVAKAYLKTLELQNDDTPATSLITVENHFTDFFSALIEAVWLPVDFQNSGVNPNEFDDYKVQ